MNYEMHLSWGRATVAVLALLLLVRLLMDGVRVLQRILPATRLILPAVLLCEFGLLIAGRATRRMLAPLAAGIEIPLLLWGAAVVYRRRKARGELPERKVEKALSAFIPQPVARALALEIVMIGLGIRLLFPPYRRSSGGFGYLRNAFLPYLPVLFVFLVPADILFLSAVLPARLSLIHRAITALDMYGLFWILGLIESARRRPHRASPSTVELNRGALNRVTFSPALMAEVAALRPFDTRRDLKEYARGALLMTLTGSGIVEIKLREPVRGDGLFPGWQRPFSRLLVAADEPEHLTSVLRALTQSAAEYVRS